MLTVVTRRLVVPRSVYDAMIRHSRSVLPAEAVGLLAGKPDGTVAKAVALPNVLGERRFLADPYAQFQALQRLKAEGHAPLAVYHSHPGGGVRLSAQDVWFARALPFLQVLIALARPGNATVDVAVWAVTAAGVEEAVLEINED